MERPNRVAGVVIPIVLVAIAGVIRFANLGHPGRIIFDETYYAKDARSYLETGVEEGFAVHPPVGKWLIAASLPFFERDASADEIEDAYQPIAWRVSTAIAGTLTVLLTYLVGARLLRWRGAAALAGLLAATDGLLVVQSRTSMLDVFLGLFVVLAAWLLLIDRDRSGFDEDADEDPVPTDDQRDLAAAPAIAVPAGGSDDAPPRERRAVLDEAPTAAVADGDVADPWAVVEPTPPTQPTVLTLLRPIVRMPDRPHPFRLLAGVAFGLAIATKWSGTLALAAGVAVVVGWELGWRRRRTGRARVDVFPLLRSLALVFVLIPMGVYVVSYVPWFLNYAHTTEGEKVCQDEAGAPAEPCYVSPLGRVAGWFRYQESIWNFHRDLEADHPYRAPAWTWPVLARPVVYYWESCPDNRYSQVPETDAEGNVTTPDPCVVDREQAAEIIALGNPALWWGSIAALVPLVAGIVVRDRRALFLLAFWGFQFIPWLIPQYNQSRPVFFFYMTPAVPFLALIVAYATVWMDERRASRVQAGLPPVRPRTAVTIAAIATVLAAGLGVATVLRKPGLVPLWELVTVVVLGTAYLAAWQRVRSSDETRPRPPRWAGLSPGAITGIAVAALAVGLFVYFYPVLSGLPLPYDIWRQRMWFPSWI